MAENARCPQCQAEIPEGAPEGLCPQCLLKAALPSAAPPDQITEAYSPPGSSFTPPTPEQMQFAFPQLEVLELIGRGGMGAVYKARQPGLDRLVAIKILPSEIGKDPAFAERFTREARALARLNHPNIVGVFDFGQPTTDRPFYWFMMEYIDGVNLRQAIRAGQLKPAEALKIVPQICDALQFAHDEGIVHRDIKPENILLDKRGRVKIADFGLAKILGNAALDVSLTGTQQVMGTLHYMAPEQFQGARDVDHRADIYSLGVTFYEMLTGELPIGRFAPPSKKVEIDMRLDEVVLRSLEQKPEERYQHASEIKNEMESIAKGPAPITVVPVAEPAEEHPLLKGSRVLMTPQPGYANWVGIPMLILTALYVLSSVGLIVYSVVFDGAHWLATLPSCGGGVLLMFVFAALNLIWWARRNSSVRARGVSFLWSVVVPAMGLILAYVVLLLFAGVVVPLLVPGGGPGHVLENTQTLILFGGAFTVVAICPLLLMIWIVRKIMESSRDSGEGKASPYRPGLVPILGVINMIIAVTSLFGIAGGMLYPGEIPQEIEVDAQMRVLYRVWWFGDAGGSYLASVAWFVGGLGMLMWKSWGRRLTVAAASFMIFLFILEIPAIIAFGVRPALNQINEAAGPAALGPEEIIVLGILGFLLFGGVVVGKVYHIAVLVYLMKPHIAAAFEPSLSEIQLPVAT